jgi:carbonic anhydrase
VRVLSDLFANNRAWAAEMRRRDPDFFARLARRQAPAYRNVANVVIQTDPNCLSALQFAVEARRVRHVIVCGHYGCGGVLAARRGERLGLVEQVVSVSRTTIVRDARARGQPLGVHGWMYDVRDGLLRDLGMCVTAEAEVAPAAAAARARPPAG